MTINFICKINNPNKIELILFGANVLGYCSLNSLQSEIDYYNSLSLKDKKLCFVHLDKTRKIVYLDIIPKDQFKNFEYLTLYKLKQMCIL